MKKGAEIYKVAKNQMKLANEIGITVVKLERNEESDDLGFSLTSDKEVGGIFVSDIKHNSAIGRKGILQPGDRIIWVNRKNVEEGITIEEAMEILDEAPNGSSIVITRWKDKEDETMKKDLTSQTLKETQLIPNLITSEEPYMLEVTYLS